MSGFAHALPVRVYYEDTDHGGVVYYANYLKFMERGRTEFLREQGLELDAIEREHGVMFAVSDAHVRYLAPARFNDLLEVESRLVHLGAARLAFRQAIRRQGEAKALCTAEIRLACIRTADGTGRPARIPRPLREALHAALSPDTETTGANA